PDFVALPAGPARGRPPLRKPPLGPELGASGGFAFPVSTAFDRGGFSYGPCRSSLSKTTSAAASRCLAASAAATPAGPPPTTTILRTAFMRLSVLCALARELLTRRRHCA